MQHAEVRSHCNQAEWVKVILPGAAKERFHEGSGSAGLNNQRCSIRTNPDSPRECRNNTGGRKRGVQHAEHSHCMAQRDQPKQVKSISILGPQEDSL